MLTRKQHELLLFINERLKETGIPPSFDEMKDALDLASKSGIHRLITALEERGFIRRLPNRARALEVLRLPESMAPGLASPQRRFSPDVIEGGLGKEKASSRMPSASNDDSSSAITSHEPLGGGVDSPAYGSQCGSKNQEPSSASDGSSLAGGGCTVADVDARWVVGSQ